MPTSRNTILFIDDDLNHGAAAVIVLNNAGYVVHFCSTGTDGLAEARAWLPTLIILDFHLPDIQGAEVGRVIRSDPVLRHTPILMNSSHEVAVVRKAFADYDHFLRKPFRYDEFLAVTERLIKTTRVAAS